MMHAPGEITLTLHHEDDSWWAETDNGYYAGANTLSQLLLLAAEGLPFHLGMETQTVGAPGRLSLDR
jgi:hypothetical protein